jgi:hypothetical protein
MPANMKKIEPYSKAALLTIIEDLLLLDDCSDTSEWAGQILYLPPQ